MSHIAVVQRPTVLTCRPKSRCADRFPAFQPPERATVHVSIAYEGPAMEPVYERVARDLDAVKVSINSPSARRSEPGHVVVGRTVAHVVESAVEQGRPRAPVGAPCGRRRSR